MDDRVRAWHKANVEKVRGYQRAYKKRHAEAKRASKTPNECSILECHNHHEEGRRLCRKHLEYGRKRYAESFKSDPEGWRAYQRSYSRTPKCRFKQIRNAAKRRNLEFTLTLEDVEQLLNLPCFYCREPKNMEVGTGIDRKNNNLGYVPGNVVPCCRICNVAKNDFFSAEEMAIIGEAISRVLRARKD